MGHWGTAILSNDTSADIKDAFFNLYDKGQPLLEIRKEIEKQFKHSDILADNTDLWLTLALLQWQVGYLDKDVKELAEKIIDQDIDLNVWMESDADEKTLAKRKSELFKLREKLQISNLRPRKLKKIIIPKSIFKKGEVYAFPLKTGNFTALIILEEILNENYYFILIANTDINKKELPTVDDVLKSNLITKTPYEADNFTIRPAIASYTNAKYKKIVKTFIKVGDVIVKEDYTKNYLAFGGAPWILMIDWANMNLSNNKLRPKEIFPVTNYVKKLQI